MPRKEDVYTIHYVPATEAQKQAFVKRLYELLFPITENEIVNALDTITEKAN